MTCVREHVLDEPAEHRLVLFKTRGSTPKSLKQFSKIFELHCEQCDCLIRALCISSFDHELHFTVNVFKKLE